MWVIEMWHGVGLVLGFALGVAALTALSCVAMAGIDGGEDQDATHLAPIRPPAGQGPHALNAGHPRLVTPMVAGRATHPRVHRVQHHRPHPRLGRVATHL